MYGIKDKTKDTLHYLWLLVQEYEVIAQSQLYTLLKISTNFSRNARKRLITRLQKQVRIFPSVYESTTLLTSINDLEPTITHYKIVQCVWILLDYIEQIDKHFATGTYSRISMIIEEKDYDIVYVEKGEENLCLSHIENNGETTYIIVVEHPNQISFLYHQRIKTFATVSEIGKITYYKQN